MKKLPWQGWECRLILKEHEEAIKSADFLRTLKLHDHAYLNSFSSKKQQRKAIRDASRSLGKWPGNGKAEQVVNSWCLFCGVCLKHMGKRSGFLVLLHTGSLGKPQAPLGCAPEPPVLGRVWI
jgi:hypothetical protein